MMLTKNQIKYLTRKSLIEELLKGFDIRNQLNTLNDTVGTLAAKHE